AIESCIAAGAKGILLAAPAPTGLVSSVKKARDVGLLVIALDTPLEPADAADAIFATDNLLAGKLIGQWAKETMGDKAKYANVGFLDLTPSQPTVDVLRDQG
ncbi:substrate-binding domain-containing protein, partial [Rhizobium ruizarguesonis]